MNEETEKFRKLLAFFRKIPSIQTPIKSGELENGQWWIKFGIDISHPLAWHVVQELGHILNYLSLNERLPTVFMPVSPPPYLNGGPSSYLTWIIESKDSKFVPDALFEWLEGRLPRPIDDVAQWEHE